MFGISKPVLHTAAIALAAVLIVAFVQRKVFALPVLGDYLPK
jgi:hypothetical protein